MHIFYPFIALQMDKLLMDDKTFRPLFCLCFLFILQNLQFDKSELIISHWPPKPNKTFPSTNVTAILTTHDGKKTRYITWLCFMLFTGSDLIRTPQKSGLLFWNQSLQRLQTSPCSLNRLKTIWTFSRRRRSSSSNKLTPSTHFDIL